MPWALTSAHGTKIRFYHNACVLSSGHDNTTYIIKGSFGSGLFYSMCHTSSVGSFFSIAFGLRFIRRGGGGERILSKDGSLKMFPYL